jgi:hypothetical protein
MTKKKPPPKKRKASQHVSDEAMSEHEEEEDTEGLVDVVKQMQAEIGSLRALYEEQVALSTKLGLDVLSQTQKLTEIMNDRPSNVSKKATVGMSAECTIFLSTWEARNSNLKVRINSNYDVESNFFRSI